MNIYSTSNDINCNFSTDQIILKPIPQYDFELYATERAFSMLINFSTIVKNIRQSKYLHFLKIFYLCSLPYFIYSSIMSNHFSEIEPMDNDIEGEAVCAYGSQSVMA